jgi:hypothetical protein
LGADSVAQYSLGAYMPNSIYGKYCPDQLAAAADAMLPVKVDAYGAQQLAQSIILSVGNSTKANILAGATWTGVAELTYGITAIQVVIKVDKTCTVYIDQGIDSGTYEITDSFDVVANVGDARTFASVAPYFRIRVKNTSVDPTTLVNVATGMTPFLEVLPRKLAPQGGLRTTGDQYVVASTLNSSAVNVNAGATWTGTAESTLGVVGIQISLKTDKNCTVYVDQSPDGTNWDIVDTYRYFTEVNNFGITVQAINSFFRVRVTNIDATNTTYFRFQTALCPMVEAVPRSLTAQGELKVTTNTYLQKVAEGDLLGHYLFSRNGYNAGITSALVDLWGSAAVYVFPAAPMQMSVGSTSNSDLGTSNFNGTSSGGSTTTLIDATKDFTAGGTPVAAGDIIYLQNGTRVSWGVVTTVAATTLTCAAGFAGGISASGLVYKILDVSTSGVGAQTVFLRYLDTNYQQKEEVIFVSGSAAPPTPTWLDTVATTILRVNRFEVLHTGTGGYTVGSLVIADKATRAINYAIIGATFNSAQQAIFTIPALDLDGHVVSWGYIVHWFAGACKASGNPVGTVRLVATAHSPEGYYNEGVFSMFGSRTVMNGTIEVPCEVPLKLAAKTDIKMRVISDTASTIFNAGFQGWFE